MILRKRAESATEQILSQATVTFNRCPTIDVPQSLSFPTPAQRVSGNQAFASVETPNHQVWIPVYGFSVRMIVGGRPLDPWRVTP